MTTSVLPRAICRSGAIAPNSPRRRHGHGRDTPTRARRREGPRAARAAGAQAPPGHLLPDREPRKDATGTESARSRKTDARPRRPGARSWMTRRPRAQPRGGHGVTAHEAAPGPCPAGSPEHRPPQHPRSGSASSPGLAFSSPAPPAAGPEETGSCRRGRGPTFSRSRHSSGPEEAELLSRKRRAECACACARPRQGAGLGRPLQAVAVVRDNTGLTGPWRQRPLLAAR